MGRTSTAKQRILDSAQHLIYARSYADVGVQEICDHAAVKKGSFYHFFPSKSDLALAVLDHLWEQFQTQILHPAFQKNTSPLDRFQQFYTLAYNMHQQHQATHGQLSGCPYGNLAIELSTQNPAIRLKVHGIFTQISAYFATALNDAVACGEIQCAAPEYTSRALLAYLEGVVMLAKTENNPHVIQDLRPGFFSLISATV